MFVFKTEIMTSAREIFIHLFDYPVSYCAELYIMERETPEDFISEIERTDTFDEDGNLWNVDNIISGDLTQLRNTIGELEDKITYLLDDIFINSTLEDILNSEYWNFNNACWYNTKEKSKFDRRTLIAKKLIRYQEVEGLNNNHLLMAKNDKETFLTLIESYNENSSTIIIEK